MVLKRLRISAAVLVISLVITVAIQLYEVPEPEWERNVLDNDTQARFLQVGSTGESIHIVYQKSSEEGVAHFITGTKESLLDAFLDYGDNRKWVERYVDKESGSGTYMSMTDRENLIGLSYQDSTVGSEKVIYAEFSDGNWSRQVVDDAQRSGFNVGMYTAVTYFEGEPVVAYHSPRDGLEVAFREGDGWQENNIGGNSGWFTSAASCGEEIFLAYSGRDSDGLNISSYDGQGWETENTGTEADYHTQIIQENCVPTVVYLNPSNEKLEFKRYGVHPVESTKFVRTGFIKEKDAYHLSYRDYGEGVFYANSTDGQEWNRTKIGIDYNSGKYNDITTDRSGNIHVAYSNATSLIHAEYNEGTTDKIGELQSFVTKVSLGIDLLLLTVFLVIARKNSFFTKMKRHMIQEVEEEFSEYSFRDDE